MTQSDHVVIIPFWGRFAGVARCARVILQQATPETHLLLVDDGSPTDVTVNREIGQLLAHPAVHLIRHPENRGIAAARNSALHWCREQGIDYAIMVDSDCEPQPGFLRAHLSLRERYPDAVCIGGGIVGSGTGWSAKVDGYLTWPYSIPEGETWEATSLIYNLPTANLALRLSRLPAREFIFDERLATNEDCLFVREMIRNGEQILFSPEPVVRHADRESVREMLAHQYDFGRSSYFVQFGSDFSPKVFGRRHRALFLLGMGTSLPLYAVAGATLAMTPWLRHNPMAAVAFPAAALIFYAKGIAALETALSPGDYLREPRAAVEYKEEVLSKAAA